ncbi:MAG: zinc-binding dehydrogenase [Acidimicrobiia bacterium]|nr:zinc-binding dehydrogenase [Acidimicrobiia bacterium]
MKSVALVAPKQLEMRETAAPPEPGPGQLLVRLRSVGLCGSDMHWYMEGCVGHNPAVYPMVLGHEPVGEVAAAGAGTGHSPGELVSIEPTVSCGHCTHCLAGRHNNCIHGIFMGGPHAEGFFREYAVVPARNVDRVPEDLTPLQAALIEPVAVIVHMLELVNIRVGDTVVVLGTGPIGLLAAALARQAGAGRVITADRVAHRVRLARQTGVDVALDMSKESIVDAVMDVTKGRGAEVVIDAAGAPETIQAGLALAAAAGQFVLLGIPSQKNFPVDLHTAMAKELRIQTIKRSNHRGAEAIRLLADGRIPESIITHRMPIDNTPEAFELLEHYRDGVGKIVIEMP